ncbi:MAG: hypothetical protein GYB35_03935 [Algicola sp.]|nr:hypothetical protein [Algicola sp.]
MKKTITILMINLLFFSCSSSDDSEGPQDNNTTFDIILTASSESVVIDELLTVNITSTSNITNIEGFANDQSISFNLQSDFGTGTTLYFSFDTLGNKTISVTAKNASGQESIKTISVDVERGNAIKINQLQINSFSDINNTWDPEFVDSDPNRLADVFFGIVKGKINPFEGGLNFQNWHTSIVKENQGDLTWDLSTENLYLDPNQLIRIGLADDDGGGISQDLLLGPPSYRELSFSEYIILAPSTVTVSDPSIDLEISLTLDWNN